MTAPVYANGVIRMQKGFSLGNLLWKSCPSL